MCLIVHVSSVEKSQVFFLFVGNQVLNNQLLKKKIETYFACSGDCERLDFATASRGTRIEQKKMNNKIRNLQFDVGV